MSAVVAAVGPVLREVDRLWVRDALALLPADGDVSFPAPGVALGQALVRTGAHDAAGPVTVDGRVHVAADVRLDARAELRTALRAAGWRCPDGASDAELLLLAYAAWGDRLGERLLGDFAFVLWDDERRRLLAVRDQLGVAPLHVAHVGRTMLVASGVDALLLHPGVGTEIDDDAVAGFLALGHDPDLRSSCLRRVRRVPPGHVETWSAGGASLARYWAPDDRRWTTRFSTPGEYAEAFRAALDDAVLDRLPAGPVGAHLSGGMDSGAVVASAAAVLRRQRGHADDLEVTTMVLGAGSGDGEGAYAEEVRTHLGLVGTLFSGAEATVLDPLGEPVLRLAEPQQIERTDFRLRMTRHAAARASVTLTGLGGDALLGFATTWWVAGLRAGRVASTTRALLERPLLGLGRPRPHVRAVAGVLWAGHPTPGLPGWLAAGCRERAAVHARRDRLGRLEGFDVADLYRSPFWSDLARRGHPSVSKRPMQHRHPLYDLRLIRLMGTIAPEVWTPGKRLLRDATGDRLPERVRRRPKRPLVRATLPGDTPAAQGRLAELVLAAPDLDRYVDRSALAAACRPGATEDPGTSTTIDRALGLAHWLAHR